MTTSEIATQETPMNIKSLMVANVDAQRNSNALNETHHLLLQSETVTDENEENQDSGPLKMN